MFQKALFGGGSSKPKGDEAKEVVVSKTGGEVDGRLSVFFVHFFYLESQEFAFL